MSTYPKSSMTEPRQRASEFLVSTCSLLGIRYLRVLDRIQSINTFRPRKLRSDLFGSCHRQSGTRRQPI